MTIVHPSYGPYNLTRTQHYAWSINAITYAPQMAVPTGLAVTPSQAGVANTAGSATYWYVITALSADGVTESQPCAYVASLSKTMSITSCFQTLSWTPLAGASQYNVYRTAEVDGGAPVAGMLFGLVGSVLSTGFQDHNITPDFTQTPPQAYNPFSGSNNPSAVCYYQGREIFAGTVNQPDGIFASKTGDYFNMDYSTPGRANDGMAFTLASQQVNAIKHLVPMYSMLALTSHGAFKIDGGGLGVPITPSNISVTPQAYNGCSDVPPLVINYDILYVQAKGSKVRDLAYNFYVNLYTGSDISVLSTHLFFGYQILQWAWAEEPHKIVWAVRNDGQLLSLTYLKEQDVMAWAHHDTQGLFQSICTVPEGTEDAIYVVVARQINGQNVQYVERLHTRNFNGDVRQAFFVDAGVSYAQTYPAATMTPAALNGTGNLTSGYVANGGSGYTAPVLSISDPTGQGASGHVQMSGGVITGVVIDLAGFGYTAPVLSIVDPTGVGAAVYGIVTNSVLFTTDNAVMTGTVGQILQVNGGTATITSVNSANSVYANVTVPLTSLWPAAPGTWTCTPQTSTVSGLDHLNGASVSVVADGSVLASQQVAAGSITLPTPASQIVVGLPYTSQLQTMPLDVPAQGGTVQGKRKKVPAAMVRVWNTRGLQVGRDFGSTLRTIKERTPSTYGGMPIPLTSGDERIVLDGPYDVPGQICIQQSNPLPATVLAIIPEIAIGDT